MSKQINPLLGKKKKKSKTLIYIVGLFVFLMGGYIAEEIQNKRVYDSVKNKASAVEDGLEELSKEEKQSWLELREKVIKIYQAYLSKDEFNHFWSIIQKSSSHQLSMDEFRRGEHYDSKVRKSCTSEERKILDEMGRLNMKIAEGK